MNYVKRRSVSALEQDVSDLQVAEAVKTILNNVKSNGLEAVRSYSSRLDRYDAESFRLTDNEISAIVAQVDPTTIADLAFAQQQIRHFAEIQRSALKDVEVETHPGVILGHRNIPVSSVACYVPGGRYPLVASAHMGIVTAKSAGVKRVVAMTPPVGGKPHPATIAAMRMAGADEIHLIGGAHALAAAAYGTAELAPVDMIVGPGNAYVAEAKKQLFGRVGIDLLAGPTEVLIIADDSADAETVATDLLGQAEHGPDSPAALITTSEELAFEVLREVERQLLTLETAHIAGVAWQNHGEIIVVESDAEALLVADRLACEHVQVLTRNNDFYLDHLSQYGSLFIGEMTCVAYGDKVIGTNHTLPTRGAAKYTGGLWVGKFLKTCTYQRIESAESSVMLGEYGSRLCAIENFSGHKRQMDLRVEKFGNATPSAWRRSGFDGASAGSNSLVQR